VVVIEVPDAVKSANPEAVRDVRVLAPVTPRVLLNERLVPVAAPRTGVVRVGLVSKTKLPVPVVPVAAFK
jgi:hypothetical protein